MSELPEEWSELCRLAFRLPRGAHDRLKMSDCVDLRTLELDRAANEFLLRAPVLIYAGEMKRLAQEHPPRELPAATSGAGDRDPAGDVCGAARGAGRLKEACDGGR